jgi:hypothetical protein
MRHLGTERTASAGTVEPGTFAPHFGLQRLLIAALRAFIIDPLSGSQETEDIRAQETPLRHQINQLHGLEVRESGKGVRFTEGYYTYNLRGNKRFPQSFDEVACLGMSEPAAHPQRRHVPGCIAPMRPDLTIDFSFFHAYQHLFAVAGLVEI